MRPVNGQSGTIGDANDIAIVGMSCVFPAAPDLKTYWRNILCKVDAVCDPPADWGADVFYDPDSTENDRIYCKRGGYLHDLAAFDPLEYGVMPSSVDGGEPDHFLALRVAHEALADAGYHREGGREVAGERVEVILGRGAYINRGFTNLVQHGLIVDQTLRLLSQLHPEYTGAELARLRQDMKASLPPFNPEMAPGLVPNILSGRIANRLDLMGPNFTIDAACASSLIAIERAMQDLLAGRCDVALTGGIHCSSPPPIFMVFCQLNALSRRGKIQPFSEDADGTLLGEGLGMLVLKRAADARAEGDRIYAILKAVGSASDGRALGLLAPRVEGEELAMRRAYEAAAVSPASVGLLEAHGTGTAVGDQTEAQAIARVFGLRDGRPPSCALGSVKSMISHLIPAAGVAGVIKAALALYYKVLPPTLHCDRPNPKLGLDQTPLFINSETRPWIHGLGTPRRAGVNAFGFGGINAHAILEECTSQQPALAPDGGPPWDSEAIILRARTREELAETCRRLDGIAAPVNGHTPELRDLAFTLNCPDKAEGGSSVCLGLVTTSVEELRRKLAHCAQRLADPACEQIKDAGGIYFFKRMLACEGKVAFLFPGEGSPYLNMFADLCLRLAPVRERFDLIDRAFLGHSRGWLPSQVIFPSPLPNDSQTRQAQERRLAEMDFCAEAVFAASQGMLALLAELEIHPELVTGHSGGEISALLAAGIIRVENDDELVRHISDINQLYGRLCTDRLVPGGCALAVSGAERETVLRVLREFEGQFKLGIDNCPHQVVLCGPESSAEALADRLRAIGAVCSSMPFQRPYHTSSFEPYAAQVRPFFDRLKIGPARVPAWCAATACPFPIHAEEIRQQAARLTAEPVRFRETIEAMHEAGARIFVEVGPKGTLTSFVADTLRGRTHVAIASDRPNVSGILQLNHLVAHLAAHGVGMRLNTLYERRGARRITPGKAIPPNAGARRPMQLRTGLTDLRLKDPLRAAKPATRSALPAPASTRPESTSVAMKAYLASMDQFLSMQQEVMEAYLHRSAPTRPAVAGISSLPVKERNGNGAALVQDEVLAKPSSNGSASHNGTSHNGHQNVLATLLDIISERTGYPCDMLAPALNLEADLGIDSIKRVEILGALHRQTGLVEPDRMEHISSLKTIAEIVACLDGEAKRAETPEPVPPALPLAGTIESLQPQEKLVWVRTFDVTRDLFLNDHTLGSTVSTTDPQLTGLPLIPLTMTVEMMAEAAVALRPGKKLIGMRKIRGLQWLALDEGILTLRCTAKLRSAGPSEEVSLEVHTVGESVLVAEGIASLADDFPEPPTAAPLVLKSARPSQWTPERLYRDHMFHGPSFRGIETIDQWGENGLVATLISLPTSGLLKPEPAPVFLTEPVLLDAAGQMVGYWAAEHLTRGFNVFPYRIEALEIFGPPLAEGHRARCQADIRLTGDTQILADLDIIDGSGRVLLRATGWEDIRVELPDACYRMCLSPRGVSLSAPQMLPDQGLFCCSMTTDALPSLTAHGGIWLRALVHAVLNSQERQVWRDLKGPPQRRIEWLLGRCCAKDAVRSLARQSGQPELFPADVEIIPDANGRPVVSSGVDRPAISIAHADGVAVAVASREPDTFVGVDVLRLGVSHNGFEDIAFSNEERSLIRVAEPNLAREYAIRLWCAKEAAAKALGTGLLGGPRSLVVRSFDPAEGSVTLQAAGAMAERFPALLSRYLVVHTSRQADLIIATCIHRILEEPDGKC